MGPKTGWRLSHPIYNKGIKILFTHEINSNSSSVHSTALKLAPILIFLAVSSFVLNLLFEIFGFQVQTDTKNKQRSIGMVGRDV